VARNGRRPRSVGSVPGIVLGKYVAVTSIDSGALTPTDNETAAGWQSRAEIAYSPKIQKVEDLPREGWDEWYTFNAPTDLGTSHLAENIFEVPHLADVFWPQMARIRPESYVAKNDYITFVSMNKALFAAVRDAVKGVGE
jgi:hypothetical protein